MIFLKFIFCIWELWPFYLKNNDRTKTKLPEIVKARTDYQREKDIDGAKRQRKYFWQKQMKQMALQLTLPQLETFIASQKMFWPSKSEHFTLGYSWWWYHGKGNQINYLTVMAIGRAQGSNSLHFADIPFILVASYCFIIYLNILIANFSRLTGKLSQFL